MSFREVSGRNKAKAEPPHATDSDQGDVTDILAGVPRRVRDLCDRWLMLRRRGLRPQDITEILGFARTLSELLQQTELMRSRGAARSLEDRLRLHNNSMMAMGVHEQESIGYLFSNLRQTLDEEWGDLSLGGKFLNDVADEPPEPAGESADQSSPDDDDGHAGTRVVFLFDPDSTTAEATRSLLHARGYTVRVFAVPDQLTAALPAEGPCWVIADLDHWPDGPGPIPAVDPNGMNTLARHRLLFLSTDFSHASRLRGLRSGGQAVLEKPVRPDQLLLQLATWDTVDAKTALRCLLVESDPARSAELEMAFADRSIEVTTCTELLRAPEAALSAKPDVVILPWSGSASSALQVARILREDQDKPLLPILFAVDPERAREPVSVTGFSNAVIFDGTARTEAIAALAHSQASAHREQSASIQIQNIRDTRTGLLHACAFERTLQQRVHSNSSRTETGVMTLMHLELDEYDLWCNECAAKAMTRLLAAVANAIAAELGPDDVAARLGDGRFAVFTLQPDMDAAAMLANRLREAVVGLRNSTPLERWLLGASIGLCRLAADQDLFTLFNRARHLSHDAKQLGGNRVQIEKATIAAPPLEEERKLWTERVRLAVTEKRLYLVFQPIATLAADRTTRRFEVLVRIRGGWTEPTDIAEFFRMAEEVGLSCWLDRWILQQAIESLVANQRLEPETQFFVKMSRATLQDLDFQNWLKATLERFSPEPGSVVLEVSAADVMLHPRRVQALLEEMRSIEVPVAMEHLGVDEDAVRLLQELHTDFVKFQASVTASLGANTHALQRLHEMLAMAQSRGIKTMAAYVEDANGLALLWNSRFDLIQGNFLRQPEQSLDHDIEI